MEVNDLLQNYYLDLIQKRKSIKGSFLNVFKLLLLSIEYQKMQNKHPSLIFYKKFSRIVDPIFRFEYANDKAMEEILLTIYQIFVLTSHHFESVTIEFPIPLAFGMPTIRSIINNKPVNPQFLDLALDVFSNCSKTFTNPRSIYQLDWAPAVGQLAFYCLQKKIDTPYYDRLINLFIANPSFVNFDDIDVSIFTGILSIHEMSLVSEREYLHNISRLDPEWNPHSSKAMSIIKILSRRKSFYFISYLVDQKPLWRISVLLRYIEIRHRLIQQYIKKSEGLLIRKRDIFALKQLHDSYSHLE